MKRLLILATLLLASVAAFASPVPLAVMTLVSFDGPIVNSIPTYPYTLAINPNMPFWAMCDDYYHDGTPGDIWYARLNNLAAPTLSTMRFGSQGLVPYQEVGWLFLQTTMVPSSQWPDINYAVWHIFNPTVPINSNSQRWIDLAAINYPYGDYSLVWVATPLQIDAPPTGDQEFFFMWPHHGPIPAPPIPEPGTLSLMAIALAGTAAALKLHRAS